MSPSRRPGNARANFAWVMRDVFNTKGHKELLSGMYRSTKFLRVSSGTLRKQKILSEAEPLCSYPFTVMVFVFLCVLFSRGFACEFCRANIARVMTGDAMSPSRRPGNARANFAGVMASSTR